MKQHMITNSVTNNAVKGVNFGSFISHSFMTASMLPVMAVTVGALASSLMSINALLSDFSENEDDRYSNKYGVFASGVNLELLDKTIQKEFMPYLTKKAYWFAVWYLLLINGCLKNTRRDFCLQMHECYGDRFSLNCLDAYAATCLSHTDWHTWEKEVLNDFVNNERESIEQGRISLRTARDMLVMCKQFDPIMKKKQYFKS